ncbi:MAG: heme exporter protein CcmB, partial [Pseudomonadota bacterium]
PKPLTVTVLAKSASHWIASCLPIVLLSPALASALHLPTHIILPLTLSLLLGTPALSMIGGMAAALTVTIKNGTVLITLLVLPLCIPVLIVGTGAVVAATNGLPYVGHIGLLSAYSLLCLSLMPLAIAAALKISVSTG